MLQEAHSDVLILLDCCAAASSVVEAGSGVTEPKAACGFETVAPGVGQHSFTRSLIEELDFWVNKVKVIVVSVESKEVWHRCSTSGFLP